MKGLKGMELPEIDRRRAVQAAVAIVAAIVVVWAVASAAGGMSSMRGRVSTARADLETFRSLGEEYLAGKAALDVVSGRAFVSGVSVSPVELVEEIARRVGLEGGISSMKPLGERTAGGYTERAVEFTLERIDLNQLLNLLYLVENNRALLVVKEFSVKSTFEDPELLDVSIRVAHLIRLPV